MPHRGKKEAISIQVLQLVDALLVWLSFWTAYVLRDSLFVAFDFVSHIFGRVMLKQPVIGLNDISWILFIAVPFTPLAMELFGFYRNPLRQRFPQALWQMLRGIGVIGAVVAVLALFLKLPTSSRLILGTAVPLGVLFLSLRYAVVRTYAVRQLKSEGNLEALVLAGSPEDIDAFLKAMPDDVKVYWRVVGRLNLTAPDWDEFRRVLNEESVERVVFAASHSAFDHVARAIEICEMQGVEAWLAAGFLRTQIARPTFDNLGGSPMLVLRSTPDLSWAMLVKGVIDRLGAFMLVVLTLPLWIAVAIGIKLQSPGPVFYFQDRAGRYGRPFRMWKFRSMIVDADKKLEELKQQAGNVMSGPVFKLHDDPRIFPLGKLMRKYSIDELPQLINVLKGEMSLVGPRPMAVYELPNIEKSEQRRKLSVKPGLTCIWQVSGRNHITDFSEWVKLDLQYIDNWSLWLDFKILLKTIPAVLFAKGAK